MTDQHGVPERTLRRWLAAYRAGGLAALARRPRSDRGTRRTPPEVQLLIEGLALLGPGALWGAIFGYAAHAATRGQRDFSSVLTLAAARYDLIARDGTAERARTMLSQAGVLPV